MIGLLVGARFDLRRAPLRDTAILDRYGGLSGALGIQFGRFPGPRPGERPRAPRRAGG